jgi:hypothetical protein
MQGGIDVTLASTVVLPGSLLVLWLQTHATE